MIHIIDISGAFTEEFGEMAFLLICTLNKAGVIALSESGYKDTSNLCIWVESNNDATANMLDQMNMYDWLQISSFENSEEATAFLKERGCIAVDLKERILRANFKIASDKIRERSVTWCRENAPDALKGESDEDLWVHMYAAYERHSSETLKGVTEAKLKYQ